MAWSQKNHIIVFLMEDPNNSKERTFHPPFKELPQNPPTTIKKNTSLVYTLCVRKQIKGQLRNNIYGKLSIKFIAYFFCFWKSINQGWCIYFVNWGYNGKRWWICILLLKGIKGFTIFGVPILFPYIIEIPHY